MTTTSRIAIEPGSRIDRFTALDQLGVGGMGVVVAAYDPVLDRKVALKVLRGSRSRREFSSRRQARLHREAQAMARLSHPNVITVYEVGTFEGQVFLAMEHVDGQTLTEWLKSRTRSWREIVEVFRHAGRGLAAAHQAHLIHRDFKPDNVLVGDDGRVRVTDFGLVSVAETGDRTTPMPLSGEVAIALIEEADADHASIDPLGQSSDELPFTAYDDPLPQTPTIPAPDRPPSDRGADEPLSDRDPSNLTLTGALIGTPRYMSPEQHQREPVTAASDQYAFCVALYEALHGEYPFHGETYRELAKNVIAGERRPEPRNVAVPSWLRQIALRGMASDPGERFPSMDDLIAQLGRDPDARRRRRIITAAVAAIVALSVVILGFTLDRALEPAATPVALCQDSERKLEGVWDPEISGSASQAFLDTGHKNAGATFERVRDVLDLHATRWAAMRKEACEATHITGEQSERMLDLRMQCLDRRLGELQVLTELFTQAPDRDVVDRAVQSALHLTPLARCADTHTLDAAIPLPADPLTRRSVIQLRMELARAAVFEAAGQYRKGIAIATRVRDEAELTGFAPMQGEAEHALGSLLVETGKFPDAESSLRRAAMLAAGADDDARVAEIMMTLAQVVGVRQARHAEARALILAARLAVARAGNAPLQQARLARTVAEVAHDRGDTDEAKQHLGQALEIYRAVLGDERPETAAVLNSLGNAALAGGALLEAKELYARSLEIRQRTLGPAHPDAAISHNNLGAALVDLGDYPAAEKHLDAALAIWRDRLGKDHPNVAATINTMAQVSLAEKRYNQARRRAQRSLRIRERTFGADHPQVAKSHLRLGYAYLGQGDHERSIAAFERARVIAVAALGPEHTDVASSLLGLAENDAARGRCPEAIDTYRQAIAIWERAYGPDYGALSPPLAGIGTCQLALGEPLKALPDLEKALALAEGRPGDPAERAAIELALSRALVASQREHPRAIALAERARDAYRRAGRRARDELADAESWLRSLTRAR